MTDSNHWIFFLALLQLAAAVGCGGSAPDDFAYGDDDALRQASEPEVPPPWSDKTPEQLSAIVRRADLATLAKQHDGFSEELLESWLQKPAQAPPLDEPSSKALVRLATLAVIERNDERARALLTLVRRNAINRHLAFVGAELFAEMDRRAAGADAAAQREAIREALQDVPLVRLSEAVRAVTTVPSEQAARQLLQMLYRQPIHADSATGVLFLTQLMPAILEAREHYVQVISTDVEKRVANLPEEYAFVRADLEKKGARPIVVAVWGVGADPEVLGKKLYRNPKERPNEKDDDDNQEVDDIHGLVSDGPAGNSALLYEPELEELDEYLDLFVGVQRLRAGMEWLPGGAQAAQVIRQLDSPMERWALERKLSEIAEWAHGTHAAGTLLEGNPPAKVAIFRSAWGNELRNPKGAAPDLEQLEQEAEDMKQVARFIRDHEIRVVNVNLGFRRDALVAALRRQQDLYPTEEAVQKRADQIHAQRKANWREVFAAAPQTLFIMGAGNEGHHLGRHGDLPASVEAPNVLAVGALDPWADWAVFTNFGPDEVTVFERGVEVEGVVPGGREVALSGTTMAAPQVGNLAAKILAIAPSLSPAEVVAIIEETGDPVPKPFAGTIPNAQKALEKARQKSKG